MREQRGGEVRSDSGDRSMKNLVDEVPSTLWRSAKNGAKASAQTAGAAVREAVNKRSKKGDVACESRESLLSMRDAGVVEEDEEGGEYGTPRTRTHAEYAGDDVEDERDTSDSHHEG